MALKKKVGRPAKPPEEKPQQFSIRLLRHDVEALRELAAIHGTSLSGAVERAVRLAVAKVTPAQRKALAALKKAREESA